MEDDINKTISDLMKSIQMNWNSINQIQNSIIKTRTHIEYQSDIEIRYFFFYFIINIHMYKKNKKKIYNTISLFFFFFFFIIN